MRRAADALEGRPAAAALRGAGGTVPAPAGDAAGRRRAAIRRSRRAPASPACLLSRWSSCSWSGSRRRRGTRARERRRAAGRRARAARAPSRARRAPPRRPCPPSSPGGRRGRCPAVSSSSVSTPKPTGLPVSSATRVSPSVAAAETYSKCGVPPRMITPSATTASAPASSAALLTTGSSKLPGTRTSEYVAPDSRRACARRPAIRPSVISSCQVPATIDDRQAAPVDLLLGVSGLLLRSSCWSSPLRCLQCLVRAGCRRSRDPCGHAWSRGSPR